MNEIERPTPEPDFSIDNDNDPGEDELVPPDTFYAADEPGTPEEAP